MGRIVLSENVSLDGVVQDPTGDEGFGRGGWFARMGAGDREAWNGMALEEAAGADALLLGRRSYEFFAARWPARSGALAERLNGMPKYVVSSTLADPAWSNTVVLGGDAPVEASRLKRRLAGDVVVYASFQLGRALMARGLVDELRLMTFPVVLGCGERLFGDTGGAMPMRTLDARRVGDRLVHLTYESPAPPSGGD